MPLSVNQLPLLSTFQHCLFLTKNRTQLINNKFNTLQLESFFAETGNTNTLINIEAPEAAKKWMP